jgi:hypothetical protein
VENLCVELPGFANAKSVRPIIHGPPKLTNGTAIVPKLSEIELLTIE